ncbi:MAG: aminomethyl-transferring glycine dehydrogenase [Gemmatimonadaceae bacterium]|nr:aminomethyl-transferring glycine dehydrogenase [Gemmatimonadaceae bacterium]
MSAPNEFAARHVGPRAEDVASMLELLGYHTLDSFIDAAVPESVRMRRPLALPPGRGENAVIATMRELTDQNEVFRSYLGLGYSNCDVPAVIKRNILENPGWYTAYTPYQAEVAQGRLEALLNFQTMVCDLTGFTVANASLLDEGTAAAEAMAMTLAIVKHEGVGAPVYLVDRACHPQTIAVVATRAVARGIEVRVDDPEKFEFGEGVAGCLIQYPATDGAARDYRTLCADAHEAGAMVTVATDLLALALLSPPGEWGADIAVGNSQRFGVPLGYGGPHAAFYATKDEFKRHLPGRIIGVSRDAAGNPALRMALQTREQHIRRDKATSNVCTAQVLLAVMASMYAVYHGPEGIRAIATRVHRRTVQLARGLRALGCKLEHDAFFDTVCVLVESARQRQILDEAASRRINLRALGRERIVVALDETVRERDVSEVVACFAAAQQTIPALVDERSITPRSVIPDALARKTEYLTHPVFARHRSETEMLRYMRGLEAKDLSLTAAMIPLGSCTMKLNATTEMLPVSWPKLAGIHPFAPRAQTTGYLELFHRLEADLCEITGFAAVSLQPNAGSQGEFAGLLTIAAYHRSRNEEHRDVCLIPASAHGTNPASAVMAGMRVIVIASDERGNIDVEDLRAKAKEHAPKLAALMVTYPSTHGVFEGSIREICDIVHAHGGQVYMDGANMNAQVGLCSPGDLGADVCHLNLHKTFCIPHGGGGPGMGPIGVAAHLSPFLPDHPLVPLGHARAEGTVSAAPWGSASILPISWIYIQLMGAEGLVYATKIAILSANYIARRLRGEYELLYSGTNGLVAHECILDTRPFKASAGVDVEDIAKRLIDYGFHPPTVSFPVAGTLMVEPTESESKEELDRFVDALLAIREEIREVEIGVASREDNVLRRSPHTLAQVVADEWERPYSREKAAFPAPGLRERKVWPTVARVDNMFGDRNLVCSCPPVSAYE